MMMVMIFYSDDGACTSSPILNSGVTGRKFTKFTNNVARSTHTNFYIRMAINFNPFRNVRAASKGE